MGKPRVVRLEPPGTWGVQIEDSYLRVSHVHKGVVWQIEVLDPAPAMWGNCRWFVAFTEQAGTLVLDHWGSDAGYSFRARDVRAAVHATIAEARG